MGGRRQSGKHLLFCVPDMRSRHPANAMNTGQQACADLLLLSHCALAATSARRWISDRLRSNGELLPKNSLKNAPATLLTIVYRPVEFRIAWRLWSAGDRVQLVPRAT